MHSRQFSAGLLRANAAINSLLSSDDILECMSGSLRVRGLTSHTLMIFIFWALGCSVVCPESALKLLANFI